jgi:hypothetical protein
MDRAARGEEVRATGSVPPRHGKTETLIAALVHRLKYKPGSRVAYLSYSDTFACGRSREARRLATEIGLRSVEKPAPGVPSDLQDTVHFWETTNGGSFLAAGRKGAAIGHGFDLIVVDDPFNGEREARSAAVREEIWTWFVGTVMQRLEPGGSIIIIHTRWSDDDLIGRLSDPTEPAGEDFVHVNIPAIALLNDPDGREPGTALWPERFGVEALAKKRRAVTEGPWWAQFMGSPRPHGSRIFHDPARYDMIDPNTGLNGWRIVLSIDPAGTVKTLNDNTAVGVAAFRKMGPNESHPGELVIRMLRVYSFKLEIPDTTDFLRVLQKRWKGTPFLLETSGGIGLAIYQTLKRTAPDINLHGIAATADKLLRATPAAGVWNDARFEVPMAENIAYDTPEIVAELEALGVYKQEWIVGYLKEVLKFTGKGDARDDQVDMTAYIAQYAIDVGGANDNEDGAKVRPRLARRTGGY